MPPQFWVEVLSTAVYLFNRLPTATHSFDSPYFQLFGVFPEYHSLHTFGCVCIVHLPPIDRHKFAAQSIKCAFMSYSTTQNGFVCYDAYSNKFQVSRNVIFFEKQYFFQSHVTPDTHLALLAAFNDLPLSVERFKPGIVYHRRLPPSTPFHDTALPSDHVDPIPQHSTRVSRAPDSYGFSHTSLIATLDSVYVSHSDTQAATQACWQQAMR